MKIALAQMNVVSGNPDKNVDNMISFIKKAKENNVEIIAFPEMCVGGYLLSDNYLNIDYCLSLQEYNKEILKHADNIRVIFGNISVDNNIKGEDGRFVRFNSAYSVFNNEVIKINKTLMPNYRFFDDKRYFYSNKDNLLANTDISYLEYINFNYAPHKHNINIGVEICEDMWCDDYIFNKKKLNITKYLYENMADAIFNISASPWTFGKNGARDRNVKKLFSEFNKEDKDYFFFYVNCVGNQNNGKNIITFDGGSTVYKNGDPIIFANSLYNEELLISEYNELSSKECLDRIEPSKIEQKYNALKEGLRHFGKDRKWVVGLSGGIDSAVSTCILTDTFGNDNVKAINMPSIYNSERTKSAAYHIAEQLNIKYTVVGIDTINTEISEILDNAIFYPKPSLINQENEQARIRGSIILAGLSARDNALFPNNGNKLEVALGYATLYADWNGAVCVIGDLTKTEVYEMGLFLNKRYGKEVIPKILFPKDNFNFDKNSIYPSAELKNNQRDPMKFGYHCALIDKVISYHKLSIEECVRLYIEDKLANYLGISQDMLNRWGLNDPKTFIEDLEWFFSTINNNVFKRVQSPPVIVTSKTAFGYDLRESMLPMHYSKQYLELKNKLLNNNI